MKTWSHILRKKNTFEFCMVENCAKCFCFYKIYYSLAQTCSHIGSCFFICTTFIWQRSWSRRVQHQRSVIWVFPGRWKWTPSPWDSGMWTDQKFQLMGSSSYKASNSVYILNVEDIIQFLDLKVDEGRQMSFNNFWFFFIHPM